jgi:hypothetical protein
MMTDADSVTFNGQRRAVCGQVFRHTSRILRMSVERAMTGIETRVCDSRIPYSDDDINLVAICESRFRIQLVAKYVSKTST